MMRVMLVELAVALAFFLAASAHAGVSPKADLPRDCEEVYNCEKHKNENASVLSGVYTIYPAGSDRPVQVYCDMGCADNDSHEEGKWTVIQRRIDGNVSFYRPWEHYKNGFGSADGEYWLGLENMFLMTYSEKYQLKVEMEDFQKGRTYAQYTLFDVGPESSRYKLTVNGFINGGAGDSLLYSNGRSFSTYDKYYSSCASNTNSGFWFYSSYSYYCNYAKPNGLYSFTSSVSSYKGITWRTWKGDYSSMKTFSMKIRRLTLKELSEL